MYQKFDDKLKQIMTIGYQTPTRQHIIQVSQAFRAARSTELANDIGITSVLLKHFFIFSNKYSFACQGLLKLSFIF